MDKFINLISLSALKGSRTKLTLVLDALLYAVALLAPEFMSVEKWAQLQPLFVLLASFFGIEHFEKK